MKQRFSPLRRGACLLLALLVCLSTAMTGTLAVQTATNRINHFSDTYSGGGGGGDSTVQVNVNKVWQGDSPASRPSQVTVQLYRNGVAYGNSVTLSEGNDWAHRWSNLSNRNQYSVEELDVPEGYTATVKKNSSTSFTITNTYDPDVPDPNDPQSLTVSKVWYSAGEEHPASVEVVLCKNGTAYDQVTLSSDNGWSHTWTQLETTATWTVDESVISDGYDRILDVTDENHVRIINYLEDVPLGYLEDITIAGTKTWRHGSIAQLNHPQSATIYIKNGDKVVETVTVCASTGWSYSVDVSKYDIQGQEIFYTVEEQPIDGYQSVVSGFNITNIHESAGGGGPKTGDEGNLLLWFALMLGSAMALKLLLGDVSLRRKGRD